MKKIVKLLLAFSLIIILATILKFHCDNAEGKFYGEFGDGTMDSDTVYISFSTWDTLAYSADADTYFVRRYYHSTLIDSTFGTAATNRVRTGYYEIAKRALSSTYYGQYEVEIEWHKDTKVFKTSGNYIVRDGDMENTPQNVEDAKKAAEPYIKRTNLYVVPDADAVSGGDATTWATACSLKNILARCTTDDEYYVYISAGSYTGINLSFAGKDSTITFVGAGIDRTILTGVDQSILDLPVFCLDNSWSGDIVIQDMTINAYGMQHDGWGITVGHIVGCQIRRCRIQGFDIGISIDSDSRQTIVEHCIVSRCAGSGILINHHDAVVRWNVIDSLANSSAYGINLGGNADGSHIYGNIIYSAGGKGIGASNAGADNNIIANNWVYTGDGSYPETYSDDNVYVGNHSRSGRYTEDTTATVEDDIYAVYSDVTDTVNAILDTLQDGFGSRSAIGDTIGRNASTLTTSDNIGINWGDVSNPTTTVGLSNTTIGTATSVTNEVTADMVKISGDGTAADNVELIFDGDSTTKARADFAQVTMKADGTDSHGLWVQANGEASGIFACGMHGMELMPDRVYGGASLYLNADSNGWWSAPIFTTGLYIKSIDAGINVISTNSHTIELSAQLSGIEILSDEEPAIHARSNNKTAMHLRTSSPHDTLPAITLGLTGTGTIRGTFDNVAGFWHSVALASDSGGIDADIATIINYLDADSANGIDPIVLQIRQIATDIKAQTDNLPTDPADDSDIDAQLSAMQTDLDNPNQYKANLDSTENAIADANKGNFKATGFATAESVHTAITDVNKANFKATGFAVSADLDSVNQAIADANKENFKANVDSMNQAIADANKANFKATGFAVAGDAMTLQGDSLKTLMGDVDDIKTKTDNLPSDPADDSDIDAQLSSIQADLNTPAQYMADLDSVENAIADANKPNFKATGFATSTQGDSVTNAITDVNKANFKYGGGEDSVRAYLATHDSTLLEQAAGGASNWSDAQRDSILNTILDANKANYKATGFATASHFDSVNQAIADANKPNFYTWSTTQRDSILKTVEDANKANFKATGFATADSVHGAIADANKVNFKANLDSVNNAITDVNKANFKYGGGEDSVRAYLATHDSTLLELAAGGASNWSDTQRDSVLNTILDANKPNFKATGFATPGDAMTLQDDSLNTLMTDVDAIKAKTDNLPADPADDSDMDAQLSSIQQDLDNPSQYKATGFAAPGDPMTLQSDSLETLMTDIDAIKTKTDNLPTDPADDSEIDAQLVTIQADLDNPNQYKAVGFAVAGDAMTLQGDSLNTLMTDVDAVKERTDNLPDDPADDSDIDNQLSSIQTDLNAPDQYKADVSLLALQTEVVNLNGWNPSTETFTNWSTDQRDSVLDYIDTSYAHIDSFFATTFGAGGGSDTTAILALLQNHWDANTDGYWDAVAYVDSLRIVGDAGPAQKNTETEIKEWVWYALQSTYAGSTGTMGKASGDAASCNPSGSNTIIIRLKRDSDSTVIIGGIVEVKITPGGTNYYIGETNNDGMVSFLSDNDTLFVYVDAHPISFTTPETLRIDGNEDVTYYGTPFDPGTPASANLCRVYGWIKDINDNPVVGVKVEMSITKGPIRYGNVSISPYYKTTKTNSSGYWYLDVYRTADLTPSTTKYRVYIYIPLGEIVRRDITVSGDTQELTW